MSIERLAGAIDSLALHLAILAFVVSFQARIDRSGTPMETSRDGESIRLPGQYPRQASADGAERCPWRIPHLSHGSQENPGLVILALIPTMLGCATSPCSSSTCSRRSRDSFVPAVRVPSSRNHFCSSTIRFWSRYRQSHRSASSRQAFSAETVGRRFLADFSRPLEG